MEQKHYSIYLPIYQQISEHFRAFVDNIGTSNELLNYTIQLKNDRLTFLLLDNSKKSYFPSNISLTRKSLIPPSANWMDLPAVRAFMSKYNSLISLTSYYVNIGKSCSFSLALYYMPDEYPSSENVLVGTFYSKDPEIITTLQNLF